VRIISYNIYFVYVQLFSLSKLLCDFSRDHDDDDDEKVDEGGLDISEETSAALTESEEIKEEKDANEEEDDLAEYGLDKYDEEDIGMWWRAHIILPLTDLSALNPKVIP